MVPFSARAEKLFFEKIGFSGFLLGNCEKIAVLANANFSEVSEIMRA
jgi:hypothetical protein